MKKLNFYKNALAFLNINGGYDGFKDYNPHIMMHNELYAYDEFTLSINENDAFIIRFFVTNSTSVKAIHTYDLSTFELNYKVDDFENLKISTIIDKFNCDKIKKIFEIERKAKISKLFLLEIVKGLDLTPLNLNRYKVKDTERVIDLSVVVNDDQYSLVMTYENEHFEGHKTFIKGDKNEIEKFREAINKFIDFVSEIKDTERLQLLGY